MLGEVVTHLLQVQGAPWCQEVLARLTCDMHSASRVRELEEEEEERRVPNPQENSLCSTSTLVVEVEECEEGGVMDLLPSLTRIQDLSRKRIFSGGEDAFSLGEEVVEEVPTRKRTCRQRDPSTLATLTAK